jgi:hypothetical protein
MCLYLKIILKTGFQFEHNPFENKFPKIFLNTNFKNVKWEFLNKNE